MTRRWGLVAGTAVAVLALDQLSKAWALRALGDGEVIPVVWTLRLLLAHNTGAAFSMGSNTGWVRFLPLLVLVVVGVVVWRSRSQLTAPGALAVGMILGGAVGNLIDRALRTDGGGILSGGVVDFIDFQWWPVFNVADVGVVVGGILFAVVAMRQPVEPTESVESAESADDHAGDADAPSPSAPVDTDTGSDAGGGPQTADNRR